jgi:hypothetical protein
MIIDVMELTDDVFPEMVAEKKTLARRPCGGIYKKISLSNYPRGIHCFSRPTNITIS